MRHRVISAAEEGSSAAPRFGVERSTVIDRTACWRKTGGRPMIIFTRWCRWTAGSEPMPTPANSIYLAMQADRHQADGRATLGFDANQ
jgi:hypothetical protein